MGSRQPGDDHDWCEQGETGFDGPAFHADIPQLVHNPATIVYEPETAPTLSRATAITNEP
nr:hypothetical protein GCM10017611_02490 [Rhodococcus wratislaviensis]